MTRGEILKAAGEAVGRPVSHWELLYARDIKVVCPTLRRSDNWWEYGPQDLAKFVSHLKSKPRRPARRLAQ